MVAKGVCIERLDRREDKLLIDKIMALLPLLEFVLGADAEVSGSVVARSGEVAGRISGNIEISEVLILKPTAVINGDILTNQLVVEPGATFNGACKMGHLAKDINIELPQRASEKIFKRA